MLQEMVKLKTEGRHKEVDWTTPAPPRAKNGVKIPVTKQTSVPPKLAKRMAVTEAEDEDEPRASNVYQPRPAGDLVTKINPGGKPSTYLNKAIIQTSAAPVPVLHRQAAISSYPSQNIDIAGFYKMMFSKVVPQMQKACMFLACPQDAQNLPRYNGGSGYVETASIAVTARVDLEFNTVSSFLDNRTLFAAKFRDPVRSMIVYDGNPSGKTWTYGPTLFLCDVAVGATTSDPQWNYFPFQTLACTTTTGASSYAMHGPTLYPGTDKAAKVPYWWVDVGATIKVDNNTSTSVYIRFDAYKEDGTNLQLATSAAVAIGGNYSYTVPPLVTPGYYISVGFRTANTTLSTPASFNLTITSTGPAFSHRSMGDFEKHLSSTESIRHLSAGIMYSNTSATLALQGAVASKQVDKDRDWRLYVANRDPYQTISGLAGAYVNLANDGFYGFLRPQEGDFDTFSCTPQGVISTRELSRFTIQDECGFLVLAIKVNDQSGQSGYFTWSDWVEFATDDKWYTKATPDMSFQHWKDTLEVVSKVPQFHTNYAHIAELVHAIRSLIKVGAAGIQHYGPHVMKLANWVERNI